MSSKNNTMKDLRFIQYLFSDLKDPDKRYIIDTIINPCLTSPAKWIDYLDIPDISKTPQKDFFSSVLLVTTEDNERNIVEVIFANDTKLNHDQIDQHSIILCRHQKKSNTDYKVQQVVMMDDPKNGFYL